MGCVCRFEEQKLFSNTIHPYLLSGCYVSANLVQIKYAFNLKAASIYVCTLKRTKICYHIPNDKGKRFNPKCVYTTEQALCVYNNRYAANNSATEKQKAIQKNEQNSVHVSL